MWQFREDVKYFPTWYTKTKPDGTPWTSNVVQQDQITKISTPDQARAVGLDPAVLKKDASHVVYSFADGTNAFAFCTRDRIETYGDNRDSHGKALDACGVWVIEKPARIVL